MTDLLIGYIFTIYMQVRVSDLNFSHMPLAELVTAHMDGTYPPRVCFDVGSEGNEVVFTFNGLDQPMSYAVDTHCVTCKL